MFRVKVRRRGINEFSPGATRGILLFFFVVGLIGILFGLIYDEYLAQNGPVLAQEAQRIKDEVSIPIVSIPIKGILKGILLAATHGLKPEGLYLAGFFGIFTSLAGEVIRLARKRFQEFKRGFDFLVASLGLILASPLFLICSILIKIDSAGPIFFKQERVGKDGRIFNMWKFRTMRNDAELETGPVWAAEEDPRITRLGRLLRKCHIDELPQFINVFKGEMSLIGPRPERPVFVDKINGHIPNYNERLKVRPGITGLAQVRYRYGASIKDARRKLRFDLLYIKEMCWMLDVRIMFWSVGRVLTGVGAR